MRETIVNLINHLLYFFNLWEKFIDKPIIAKAQKAHHDSSHRKI